MINAKKNVLLTNAKTFRIVKKKEREKKASPKKSPVGEAKMLNSDFSMT